MANIKYLDRMPRGVILAHCIYIVLVVILTPVTYRYFDLGTIPASPRTEELFQYELAYLHDNILTFFATLIEARFMLTLLDDDPSFVIDPNMLPVHVRITKRFKRIFDNYLRIILHLAAGALLQLNLSRFILRLMPKGLDLSTDDLDRLYFCLYWLLPVGVAFHIFMMTAPLMCKVWPVGVYVRDWIFSSGGARKPRNGGDNTGVAKIVLVSAEEETDNVKSVPSRKTRLSSSRRA